MTIVERTQPAEADMGLRSFDLVTPEERLELQVLFQEDISIIGDEPCLQVTGNIPDNRKLGQALLGLANKLLNTIGSNLP